VLIAYQRFHSGWAIALVLLADFLPGIVLSAPCGALADRCSRTQLAVGADLLRAGAFLALALVPSFPATLTFALLAGVGSAVFHPAVNAALPELVTAEQRSPATALYGALNNIGLTVGPGLTAVVLLFSSPVAVLAVNGVTFLVSAALLTAVPLGRGSAQANEASVWSATSAGARTWRERAAGNVAPWSAAVPPARDKRYARGRPRAAIPSPENPHAGERISRRRDTSRGRCVTGSSRGP